MMHGNLETTKDRILTFAFYTFILIYSILIVFKANFGFIDDHGLLDTLLVGKKMPLFIFPEIGRFFPLNGFEFSIISKFSKSPIAFYSYNVIQFLLVVYLLQIILIDLLGFKRKKIAYLIILLVILNPGFVTAWFRLFVPERNVFFFLVAFLFFFLKYQREQKIIYAILGLISANISLYYKEPVFLMVGSFAFFHLVFGWKKINIKQKIFDSLVLISSIVFISLYYFIVYLHRGEVLYGTVTLNPVLQFIKVLGSYTLTDPIIILILLPLVLWRLFSIYKNKNINIVYDSLLFSSFIYFMVFLKLNMYSPHYLLPVYTFGLISIVYFLSQNLFRRVLFKLLGVLAFFLIIFNSLPTALYFISHYKNVPNNFQRTLSFLQEYIKNESSNGKRVSIFLYGVNRNSGVEVYHSFIKYLEFRGLNYNQFDFKSDEDDDHFHAFVKIDKDSPYTIWNQSKKSEIEAGDLLVITPFTRRYIGLDKKEIIEMQQDYDLLYHADSFLEVPNLGLKGLVKFILTEVFKIKDKGIVTDNIFGLPLDFYVLKKK